MKEGSSGNGNWSSLVVGAVVGAAVGACAALLFAPRTGKETRKYLKDRATAALDQARESVQRETKGIVGQAVKEIASVQTVTR